MDFKKRKNLRTKSLKIFAISLGFLMKIHRLGNGFKTIYRKSIERVDFYSLWFPFQLPINPNFYAVERRQCLLWWRLEAITAHGWHLFHTDGNHLRNPLANLSAAMVSQLRIHPLYKYLNAYNTEVSRLYLIAALIGSVEKTVYVTCGPKAN